MADKEVIRSFLVSLGFTVNQPSLRQFTSSLASVTKGVGAVGASVAGVTVAAEAMVKSFTRSMEKLYYSSMRTSASVKQIQAFEFGMRQIGVSGDEARASLESMSRAMRLNPGLNALLNNLGVKTGSRDRVAVMSDFIKQLSKMPFYVATQYAALFGIDSDTLFMAIQGQDKLNEAMKERLDMNTQLGIDQDAAAKAAVEYENALRDIWTMLGLVKNMFAIELLPVFREANGVFREFMHDLISGRSDIIDFEGWGMKVKAVFWSIGNTIGATARLLGEFTTNWERLKSSGMRDPKNAERYIEDTKKSIKGFFSGWLPTPEAEDKVNDSFRNQGSTGRPQSPTGAKPGTGQGHPFFSRLESAYGLPQGLLDSVWKQESNRGTNMLSPKGAMGHFQFMPRTAEQYGLKDPNDLYESANAAARMYSDLLKQNGGDLDRALAGYNWGQGNLQKYGLGKAPAETRDYIDSVKGRMPSINQTTQITVNGAGNPGETARAIAGEQTRVNGDLVRNFAGVVQ